MLPSMVLVCVPNPKVCRVVVNIPSRTQGTCNGTRERYPQPKHNLAQHDLEDGKKSRGYTVILELVHGPFIGRFDAILLLTHKVQYGTDSSPMNYHRYQSPEP